MPASLVFPPFSLTTAKEIKGSTLLMLCAEDIRYELEELSVEDRILLRSFLREIVSLTYVIAILELSRMPYHFTGVL